MYTVDNSFTTCTFTLYLGKVHVHNDSYHNPLLDHDVLEVFGGLVRGPAQVTG